MHTTSQVETKPNLYTETLINSFNKSQNDFKATTANLIEEIQQKAFSFIYPEDCKMHVLAIRVKDISLKKTIAYLYATGLEGIFSLEFIFVNPEARKSGLGTILFNKALQQALQWKMRKIKLCTYEFQAPKFYEEKLGFKRISQIADALDGHSLIYLERELKENENAPSTITTNANLQFDSYLSDNFNPTELFNKPFSEIRKIYDKAISGLSKFNANYLESHDGIPRKYKQFIICLKNKNSKEIVSVIGGFILLGKTSGTTLTSDLVCFKTQDFKINEESKGLIYQSLIVLAHTYNCKTLVSYEQNVEDELESIGFSPESSLPLMKITSINKNNSTY